MAAAPADNASRTVVEQTERIGENAKRGLMTSLRRTSRKKLSRNDTERENHEWTPMDTNSR
jgi:hypothetical protein